MAVLAPIPSASELTATAVNRGLCLNIRSAYRASWLKVATFTMLSPPNRSFSLGLMLGPLPRLAPMLL